MTVEVNALGMKNNLEIQEFFVEGNNETASHVLLHIAEPVTQEEIEKGYFFALVEINGSHPEQITNLQQIIDDIEAKYYNTSAIEPNSFEHIVQSINRQSHHIFDYEETHVHALIGTLREKQLVLAYHGSPSAVLLYPHEDTFIETPIIDSSEGGSQLFSAVVEGTLNTDDYVYVATPHVADYIPPDRVRKILVGKTTRQSALHIQKVLDNLEHENSFGGILFHVPRPLIIDTPLVRKLKEESVGSEASINNFLNTTRTTEETLSPPLFKNTKNRLKGTLSRLTNSTGISGRLNRLKTRNPHTQPKITRHGGMETNFRAANTGASQTFFEKFLIMLGSGLVFAAKGIYWIIKHIILIFITLLQYSIDLTTNRSNRRTIIFSQFRDYRHRKIYELKSLGIVSKVFLILLIVLAVVFVASITYIKIRENREAESAQYTSLVLSIEDKTGDAESKLLYGEEEKARELLHEAQSLMLTLSTDTQEQQQKNQELTVHIDSLLQKLQHITQVNSELVVDISNSNAAAKPTKLVWFNGALIAYGPEDNNIYTVDPVTLRIESQSHDAISRLVASDVPKENNKIVFIHTDHDIGEYGAETKALTDKDISYPIDTSIVDLGVYNLRIYTLSPDQSQIYKHNPTQTGYDRGTPWITATPSEMSSARSIAIDGDIYVLTKNNILKFFGGERQEFSISGLDPVLDNPTELWTYADVNNLYVLEPTHKRIIVFNKDGKMKAQYTSDQWSNPTSIIVQESEKTIFVLDNNKIYKFFLSI